MARILLAEDDQNLGFMIEDNLKELGHEVSWASNGELALSAFEKAHFELCILDVMMPKMDGFELAQKIRATNEFVPIIFLTAKAQEEDRLAGFEIGGDDYVIKPFSIKELSYRIEVFLRRSTTDSPLSDSSIFSFGHSTFDSKNLIYKHEQVSYSLTQMEGSLLKLLIENQNELVRREDILIEIWGEDDYFKGRSLDVFITRLRKYLKQDSSLEIKNHHGVGFTLQVIK